jgi:hypothetical protein
VSDARLRMAASQCGVDTASFVPVEFAFGDAARDGSTGWIFITEQHDRALGPALLWAQKQQVQVVNILSEKSAGVLARRASLFSHQINVWSVNDGKVVVADAEEVLGEAIVSEAHEKFAAMIAESGAEVVREHGVLSGEVMGLEVCRVIDDNGEARLEIGVGVHDRETFQLLHGKEATLQSLRNVVEIVGKHRAEGAEHHPLNRLGAERLLRHRIVSSPQLVGLTTAYTIEPPVKRMNVKDAVPCVAVGKNDLGDEVVVVCTASVDVDVVAFAADARLRISPKAKLLIATHVNNVVPALQKLADSLVEPAAFTEVAPVRR